MEKLNNGIIITFYGHSTFGIQSPDGEKIIIDPWIGTNPSCPDDLKKIKSVDIIAITHGHFDHIGDLLDLCYKYNPRVIANWEICAWLGTRGIENCMAMNKGGSQELGNIRFIMTHAQHSSSIKEDDGSIVYGGEPGGYIIEFNNNFRIYHAGDTNLFSDMKLIAELYKPDLSMLPIGDVFTMSPYEASFACRYLQSRYVIPMHYDTFPLLTGTPGDLEKLTKDINNLEILVLRPGETLT